MLLPALLEEEPRGSVDGRTDGQTEVERARRFPLQMQLLAAAAAAAEAGAIAAEESPCRAQKG